MFLLMFNVLKEDPVEINSFSQFLASLPKMQKFKPRAYYIANIQKVVVQRKECSYTSEWVSPWLEVLWQNHRSWYAPWQKCIGFSIFVPAYILGLTGNIPVRELLDRCEDLMKSTRTIPKKWYEWKDRLYWLGRGLTVGVSR